MCSVEAGYKNLAGPETDQSDFNTLSFIIRQILGKSNFATLVQVKAVTNSGGVSPVGYVDVLPMVNMIDGYGHPIYHGVLSSLPYLRVQGGTNAIILDPQIGDIGIAVFAQQDISSIKSTKKQSNPSSYRRNDISDGLYIGGVLNGNPVQYLRFFSGGIDITSPAAVTVTAPVVNVNASTSATVTSPITAVNASTSATITTATASIVATAAASITAPSVNIGSSGQTLKGMVNDSVTSLFNGHKHTSAAPGVLTSVPDSLMDGSNVTTTVKAG